MKINDKKTLYWNKEIPYSELPLNMDTNLPNDDLKLLNDNYNFIVSTLPVFHLFYLERNDNDVNYQLASKAYQVDIILDNYILTELLSDIFSYKNILIDKKICVIYSIKKSSNYYRVRYTYADLNHVYQLPFLTNLLRKEKIKLLLEEQDTNKKSFKNFVHTLKNLDNDHILTEDIKSFYI